MKKPKLLLISATAPGSQGVGGVFLHDLCSCYPDGQLCGFFVSPSKSYIDSKYLYSIRHRYTIIPGIRSFTRLGALGEIIRFFTWNFSKFYKHRKIARDIKKFAIEENVEMIWAILNYPPLFGIVENVCRSLKIPLVTQVWDPPERLIWERKIDRLSHKHEMFLFEKCMKLSERCGVASENMAKAYKEKYGIKPEVMIHGIKNCINKNKNKNNKLIIGFCGSIYARKEWDSLILSLVNNDWKVSNREVEVWHLGSTYHDHFNDKVYIKLYGWRTMNEAINILSNADIAYVPYWFDKEYEMSTKLCFPNKICTYLAAGVPIFYHGPRSSAPDLFIEKYKVGVSCYSNNILEIQNNLSKFIQLVDDNYNFDVNIKNAINCELSINIFQKRFAQLIGI